MAKAEKLKAENNDFEGDILNKMPNPSDPNLQKQVDNVMDFFFDQWELCKPSSPEITMTTEDLAEMVGNTFSHLESLPDEVYNYMYRLNAMPHAVIRKGRVQFVWCFKER